MLEIHTYSHFFKILPSTENIRRLCFGFASGYVSYKLGNEGGRVVRLPDKVYAAANQTRTEFRFHITQLEKFIHFAKSQGIYEKDMVEVVHQYTSERDVKVELKVKEGWIPRDYQVPVIEYIQEYAKVHAPTRLVTLATGGGKSLCSMLAASELGLRTLYLLRPAFIDKWIEDVLKTFEITREDICTVQGSGQLMDLLAYASNPQNEMPKIIILSNKTYQNYLKQYEQYGEELLELGYDCLPENLYEHLGVGIRYVDEVHLDFHLNFKADLYTNVIKAAAFSASLIDSDPFMMRMYEVAFPAAERYKAPPPKKYIEARGIMYKLQDGRNPTTSWRGRKEYSHGAYEQYIMKNESLQDNYFAMIKQIIDDDYIQEYREGDRYLVFCYSIEMASRLTEFLKESYPEKTVERYVEDDAYENVMEPDIRVSTVLSAGTGIDISKLKGALLTTAISSEKSNIQALGRLRELKDDERPPYFAWLTCESIPKHVDYHRRKIELFKERTKSVSTCYYERKV